MRQVLIEFVLVDGCESSTIKDCLKNLKTCIKRAEMKKEVNEQIKLVKEKQEQNNRSAKEGLTIMKKRKGEFYNVNGHIMVPIASH